MDVTLNSTFVSHDISGVGAVGEINKLSTVPQNMDNKPPCCIITFQRGAEETNPQIKTEL